MGKSFFMVDEVFETNNNFYEKKIYSDIVTLLHVFEHLLNPVEFLSKIKKNVLINDGLIYLEIPNPYSNPLNDPTHQFLYSEDTIKYILKSCNYEIITIEQRGLYGKNSLLRSNNKLNLHIFAKSINKETVFFPKINIGNKVYSKLIKERNIVGLIFMLNRFKTLSVLLLQAIYSSIFFIINLLNSNLAVFIHEKIKKNLKR